MFLIGNGFFIGNGAFLCLLYRLSKHFVWFGKRTGNTIKGAVLKEKCKTLYRGLNQENYKKAISSKSLSCEKNNSGLLREALDRLER